MVKDRSESGRIRPLLIAALVVVPLAALGLVYLLFFTDDSPDEFTLSDPPATNQTTQTTTAGAGSTSLDGTWSVADGSEAGYRVREKLAALPAQSDAVGRTSDVTGSVTIRSSGGQLVADGITVEVDVSTLESNEDRRDNRIRTSGLESNQFPTATFTSTQPVTLPAGTEAGQAVTADVTGDLTLHGVTKMVTIPLDVRLTGGQGEVVGSLKFPFSDFGMSPPNIGGFVTVDPDATLEFKLLLARA
ncbi:MAG TPA: YceI family protein [Acidimicrobiales bacterium]